MNEICTKIIYPPGAPAYFNDWGFSPAVLSGGFLFISGCTGAKPDGSVSDGIERQTREVFRKIYMVLDEVGLDFGDVIDMTTYHVGLQKHLREFIAVKSEFIAETFPAWTAIGVSELAAENAIIEIKIIAKTREA